MNGGSIELRKATLEDIQAIITLLSAGEANDLRRLILIPESFRGRVIQSEIERGRLFVAVNKKDGSIVAQRKVFVIEDHDEQHDILVNVFRCTHHKRELVERGFFNEHHEFIYGEESHFDPSQKILYIYVGSAFTHGSHRGKRINESLNAYAYEHLQEIIYHKMRTQNYEVVALLYFVTNENHWRTVHLARPFLNFAHSISSKLGHRSAKKTSFYAYKSYKPEFTICPRGELLQLPDEHCRPGRGCILLYELAGNSKK